MRSLENQCFLYEATTRSDSRPAIQRWKLCFVNVAKCHVQSVAEIGTETHWALWHFTTDIGGCWIHILWHGCVVMVVNGQNIIVSGIEGSWAAPSLAWARSLAVPRPAVKRWKLYMCFVNVFRDRYWRWSVVVSVLATHVSLIFKALQKKTLTLKKNNKLWKPNHTYVR